MSCLKAALHGSLKGAQSLKGELYQPVLFGGTHSLHGVMVTDPHPHAALVQCVGIQNTYIWKVLKMEFDVLSYI